MSGRIAVFASGGGTNLQALLDHFCGGPGQGRGTIALVVSDRAEAGALERAERAGVPTRVITVAGRPTTEVSRETIAVLDDAGVDVVALAGYLRLVPAPVVERYRDRIVNVHPALLPAFGGKGMYGERIHAAVLEAGCRVTGVTVHGVDERYDTGRILAQWPVPVRPDDSPESLAERVLRVEHRLYPLVVEALIEAAARDEPLRPMPFDGASMFRLAADDGPSVDEVRRALGMDG